MAKVDFEEGAVQEILKAGLVDDRNNLFVFHYYPKLANKTFGLSPLAKEIQAILNASRAPMLALKDNQINFFNGKAGVFSGAVKSADTKKVVRLPKEKIKGIIIVHIPAKAAHKDWMGYNVAAVEAHDEYYLELDTGCQLKIYPKMATAIARFFDLNVPGINEKPATETSQISLSDELLKLKQLLDAGIITQAEFDAKKKQFLEL